MVSERSTAAYILLLLYIFYFWSVAKSATGLLSTRLRARVRILLLLYTPRTTTDRWYVMTRSGCVCVRVCESERDRHYDNIYNTHIMIIYYIRERFAIDFGRQIQFLEPDPFPKISRALASPCSAWKTKIIHGRSSSDGL